MMPTSGATLVVSYNGLLEPLGRSQVLAYVVGLADRGHAMRILSFEKHGPRSPLWGPTLHALQERDVLWKPLPYHRWPKVLSTAFDVLAGAALALGEVRRGVGLLHARSHVPALIADLVRTWTGVPYVFDLRGLLAEEYADSGLWRRGGLLFRVTTAFEKRFIRNAAGVVVLTRRLQHELGEVGRTVTVIPCAVDLAAFRPMAPDQPRPFDLVYSGSWSGRYLTAEVLRFFRAFRAVKPDARLLLLLRSANGSHAFPEGVECRSVRAEEMPAQLRQARAGLCFLPPGVGDLDVLLPETRTGVVLRDLGPGAVEQAAHDLLGLLQDRDAAERCRALAERVYDLTGAVESYARVYEAARSASGAR